ncbi:MAG: hypothetical protein WCF72_22905 [Pseudolabrys sp.]|jgi:hypothetical protein
MLLEKTFLSMRGGITPQEALAVSGQCSERTEDTTGMSAAAPFGRCAETQARTGIQNMDDPRTRRLLIALLIGIVLFAAGMAQHYLL